jgi:hypothetical protein
VASRDAGGTRRATATRVMSKSKINWKLIAFCVALWWFIYSAPTEGALISLFWPDAHAGYADDF